MQIVEQLSENRFVVEFNEFDKSNTDKVIIAHDYVRFECPSTIETKNSEVKLYGEHKSCENRVHVHNQTTLSIRQMIEVVIPALLKSGYMKPEHLLKPDGTPNYTWNLENETYILDSFDNSFNVHRYRNSEWIKDTSEEYVKKYSGMKDICGNKIYDGDILESIDFNNKEKIEVFKNKFGEYAGRTKSGKIIYLEDTEKNYVKCVKL